MSRSEKRRRIRRLLVGALVGAAVIVPSASAMPVFDTAGSGETSTTVIPYLSQGQASVPVPAGGSVGEQRALRADGPDGRVARQPTLRRGVPDGYTPQRYVTSAPAGDDGASFDWTAGGIGAGSAALLLALAAGAALMVSRGRGRGARA
ncbi:MAG: hypothetical protein ACM33B_08825 [Pseudomonadota bacterium]